MDHPVLHAVEPARETEAEVKVSGLFHAYAATSVLNGVDFAVRRGASVVITGRSGAGKSTLLALLGGLEPVQSGSLWVAGQSLGELRRHELAAYRRRTVGFVFQHFGLFDALTALENVELALAVAGEPARVQRSRAMDLLEQVSLSHRIHHLSGALSGGERQRVAIARALANRPRLVLADEPTGNLDEETATQVLDALDQARIEAGCTLLIVTHEEEVTSRADECYLLKAGRLSPR
jgi:ABC-type lipoprotein export system ATPase subunit